MPLNWQGYYKNLPKKRMAAGAFLFNDSGKILIVKPSYLNHWSIPGGVVNKNESPRKACIRELEEELGIKLFDIRFLGVDYVKGKGVKDESLQFVFFGKIRESKIKIDNKEIVEYKFVKTNEAVKLFSKNLAKRSPKCLEAIKNNRAFYLEGGK